MSSKAIDFSGFAPVSNALFLKFMIIIACMLIPPLVLAYLLEGYPDGFYHHESASEVWLGCTGHLNILFNIPFLLQISSDTR